MHIEQGKQTRDLKLGARLDGLLVVLLDKAGRVAARKAELKLEEDEVRREFDQLREKVETAAGLEETYTLRSPAGAIAVSLGKEFRLKEKFTGSPDALEDALLRAGAGHLFECFRIEVKPDQRKVKDNACKALFAVGEMAPKKPSVSLKPPVEGAA